MKNIKTLTMTVLFLFNPVLSHACSVCFYGDTTQPMAIGLRYGVISLLLFLLIVAIPLVKFFISFNKRAQSLAKHGTY